MSAINLNSILSVQGIGGSTSASQAPNTAKASDPDGDGDTSSISNAGQFLSNLQQLQQQDPVRFQQVMSQIAGQLDTAAQQGTGNSTVLSQLASKFQDTAQTGNLAQLLGHHGHGHHHGGAQAAYAQSQQDPTQTLLNALQTTGNSSQGASQSTGMQSLFSTIFNEVASAVTSS